MELVTSRNHDYSPYAISELSFFFIYFWEFTDGFVQQKPNINDYFWIWSSEEVRNDTESAWIIFKGSRSQKLDFPNICNLFHHFSKYLYNDYLLPNVIDSFVILVNKGNFSRPEPTCFSPLLFMFLWILFLTKYDKIMS